MKSIRSVQNQSLKNIEIIIVDDCSTDNSSEYFESLLKTDPRIRLFVHLKNMGVWRSRIDGLLYSRGKYVIFFDTGDLYEDNYVLEDAYNIINKYGLDSIKMFFRLIFDYKNLTYYETPFNVNINYTKISNQSNIIWNEWEIFNSFRGIIWNRLVRNDVYIKGLNLLSDSSLNIYKNLWEDRWWTRITDKVSNNLLVIKRFCYLYYKNNSADTLFSAKTEEQRDKLIHEFVYFLYFYLDFLPEDDKKKIIIDELIRMNNNKIGKRSLSRFRTKFYILDNLVKGLLNDTYVTQEDKIELIKILQDSLKRQIELENRKRNRNRNKS
jgi:glycosyltransferase involved in cell wall biosynthesis